MASLIEQMVNYAESSFSVSIGSWFHIYEDEILDEATWKPFANKEGKRPVVSGRAYEVGATPNTIVYPRSTSGDEDELDHMPHEHWTSENKCKIDQKGRVVRRPCFVPSGLLVEVNWSCDEPSGSDALHRLKSWVMLK